MAQNTQSQQPETLSTFNQQNTLVSPSNQRYTTCNENRFKSSTQNKLDRIKNDHRSNLFKLPIKTTRSKYREENIPNPLEIDSEVVIEQVQKFDSKEFLTIHSTFKPIETLQEPIPEASKPLVTLVTNPDEEAQRGLKEYQQKTIMTLSKSGESIDHKA